VPPVEPAPPGPPSYAAPVAPPVGAPSYPAPGAAPGYAAPGYAPAPGYPAPGYPAPGYPAPGYAPAGGYAALPPVQPKGLAITSLVLGIGSIVFFFFLLSLPAGIAAVITGHLAQRRQPYARGLWITGLITGYIGIALGLVSIVGFILLVVLGSSDPYSTY
jgi:hypothetical protein